MKRSFYLLALSVILFASAGISFSQDQLIGARYPSLSPQGDVIAFSYMGDIWTVSGKGGRAARLTNHSGYDREPVWSSDGRWIAFTSNRNGNSDIFIIPSNGGKTRQVTYHSGGDVATGFSPDGKWIYFHSSRFSSNSIYKIDINGGNALPVLDTYWTWPYYARVNPDNKSILFSTGMENRFMWRRGYKGTNSSKIWKKEFGKKEAQIVVDDKNNAFLPQWDEKGESVYFLSDREYGNKNIWKTGINGSGLTAVTKYRDKDVAWLSVASKAPAAVFERDFGIWTINLKSGKAAPVKIESPTEMKDNSFFFVKNGRVSDYKLSPDGKKIAAIVRGEIFVMAEDGGYARNITNTPWKESDLDWDKESRNIVYVSDTGANPDLYFISALGDKKPLKLTATEEDELSPKFSPDGKHIAYYRGKKQLRLIDKDGKNDRLLAEDDFGGRFASDFSWSPDSRYIAYVSSRTGNSDIFAVNIESKAVTLLTNTAYDENSPVWSPDCKFLLFRSNRSGHSFPEFTGKWDIYQLNFEPVKDDFEEDDFEKLFKKDEKSKKNKNVKKDKKDSSDKKDKTDKTDKKDKKSDKPEVKLNLENIDRQTRRVTNTLGNDGSIILSPKDKSTVYFVSYIDGKTHLWKTSLKKKERGRFSSFMANVTNLYNLQIGSKGKYLYYVKSGKAGRIDLNSRKNKSISFSTKIEVNKTADYEQMLGQLYYTLQHYYYDAGHHKINWKKTYEQFLPVLQQVREDKDFYDYANRLIGFLNSSHTGIRGPSTVRTEKNSVHFGVIWDFSSPDITIKKILKDGPVYAFRDSIAYGDKLVKVNGKTVSSVKNIHKILNGQTGKRIKLTFSGKQSKKDITVSLKPVSYGRQRNLIYEEWVESRRKIVKNKTNDKIAYLHMSAMGRGNLNRFLKELERDAVPRKGLILDLRYNMGGNVHDRVIEALTKPVYGKWQRRGLTRTNQSSFGFADKPIVVIINEVTLSDGEMASNGLKELKRARLIGNTTYGWIIFTTSSRLMNGGSFRLPFWGCYTLDGKDLETIGGIKPDITVISDLNHDLNNNDIQLERAVQEILKMAK